MKTLTIKSAVLFILFNLFAFVLLANGVHFSIKINQPIDQNILPDNTPIKSESSYLIIGDYDDYLQAMKVNISIKNNGIDSSEIIAFFHDNSITLDEAFTLLDNKIEQDKRISHSLSIQEMETMLSNVQDHEFFYTIQMGVYNEKQANSFFNFPKTFDERITSKGYFRYTYGEFKTLNDAKDALKMVKEYGLENVLIIAYDDMARIPLARAIEKENKMLEEALAINK